MQPGRNWIPPGVFYCNQVGRILLGRILACSEDRREKKERSEARGENEPKGRMEAEAEMLFETPGVDRGMARAEC
jgi:hypothetical protein